MYFEKMMWGISEMVNARAFKPFTLCSAPLKTYYELSYLKSVVVIWSVLGVSGGVTSDITLQCQLTVYYPNYSEIKEIPTFS